MKKLIAILAIAVTAQVAYADGADFSHSGEFRLQHFADTDQDGNSDDVTTAGTTDRTVSRLRWGTTFRKGDKFTGHLGLVHVSMWGENGLNNQFPGGNLTTSTNGNNLQNNSLIVNEAYGVWQASDEVSIKAGRGAATIGNGKHISKNDWETVHKAFDGLMATYDAEFGSIGFFFVQGAEFQNIGGVANQDNEGTFYGFNFDFKNLPDFLKQANLHVVQVDRQADATLTLSQDVSMRIGLNVGGDIAGIDYDVTYVTVSGEDETNNHDISGDMLDVVVGYSLPDVMNLRFYVGMHQDSGDSSATDDEQYSSFHYDMHNNAGLMDVVAWGNLQYTHAGFSLMPADGLNVGVAYYMFTQSEEGDTFNAGANGGRLTLAGNAATEDEIGTEIDLVVTKKYGDAFSIMFRYGMFDAGSNFDKAGGNNGDNDTYQQIYLAGTMGF